MVQNVVTYTVIIDVPNPEMKLRPGMTATVTVLVDKHDSTLRIPTTALRFNPPQDILDKFRQDISDQQSALQQSGGGSGQMASRDSSKGKHRRIDQQMQEQSQGQGQTPFKTSRVWVLQPDNTIKPVQFIGGLNDNHYLEVVSGDLKEGDDIVLGIFGVETSSSTQQQVNPFAPRFGGPGGGGGQRPAGGGGGGR
jgi:HlyD family secretion protein